MSIARHGNMSRLAGRKLLSAIGYVRSKNERRRFNYVRLAILLKRERKRHGPEEDVSAVSRTASDNAQAWRPDALCGHAGTYGDPVANPTGVGRWTSCPTRWLQPAISHGQRHRRLQPEVLGVGRGYLAVRPVDHTHVERHRRTSRAVVHRGQ